MLEYFKLKYKENILLKEISNKFEDNCTICKQILNILNNKTTKVKLDNDINNSYYVFINDTIYLCEKKINNSKIQRVIVIAHECIHSVQSKILQLCNFILSNIELLTFAFAILSIICNLYIDMIKNIYLIISIFSIIPRLILEIDASLKSINLSKKYLIEKLNDEEEKIIIHKYRVQTYCFLPIFVLALMIGRFLRILIIYLLIYNIK